MSLFLYPAATRYGKTVPKNRFYEKLEAGRALQRLFVEQVEEIRWDHVLSSQTLNIAESGTVKEIQVFTVALRIETPDAEVLGALNAAIPSPLVLELVHGHRVRMAMAWKRPHLQDPSRRVVGPAFLGPWQFLPGTRQALPPVLHLEALQEHLFRSLLPLPSGEGETLANHLQRVERVQELERELARLERQCAREPQFNRQMELQAKIQALRSQCQGLESS